MAGETGAATVTPSSEEPSLKVVAWLLSSPAPPLKRAVTIRLDEATIKYFKELADEAGIGYQTLINSYLKDCAATGRRPSVRWARAHGTP
jgi:uncharacterized protein (DUF4415 family)